MTIYGNIGPASTGSAPLVIGFGVAVFIFSGIEMLIDILVPPQRQYWRKDKKTDATSNNDGATDEGNGIELRELEEGRRKRTSWDVLCVEETRMGCDIPW